MRRRGVVAGVLVLGVALLAGPSSAGAVGPSDTPAFSKTETISRAHLVAGVSTPVDTRTVTATVSQTTKLRDRQAITVQWSGAHPTGGLVADVNSSAASQEEYPVVVMQCRGVDDSSAPTAKQVSPQTCWTQTPLERFQADYGFTFPPYRVDLWARPADRTAQAGQPDPFPSACEGQAGSATHWVPFVAADGHAYYGGGRSGCAGIAPEASLSSPALQPSNTTYGVSDLSGNGSAKFVVQTADTNASLGCSDTVACSLVIIPIMGISCDTDAAKLPVEDQPGDAAADAFALCSKTGFYKPGDTAGGSVDVEDLAVAGQLWWSESNWRNRITVPLSFSQSASVCSVFNSAVPAYVYGSETMAQATEQWGPHFCLNSTLFKFQHVQTGEPQAKNLLESGSIEAAFQAGAPQTPFTRRVVEAPVAVTGFVVAVEVDDVHGHPAATVKLNPRLLAKLLSESYPSNSSMKAAYAALGRNPSNIAEDPEFQALNPGLPTSILNGEQAASILTLSSDSDVIWALTSYLNADPEARAWLNGTPDPWGMVVNPRYERIVLPVTNWPLLDTFIPKDWYATGTNPCLTGKQGVPWLPLVSSPVSNLATITLDMQFDIANPLISCSNAQLPNQKLVAMGRQAPGNRFIFGITSLPDAERYQLSTAALQTQVSSGAGTKFTDSTGRTFVAPSYDSLKAAVAMLKPDKTLNTWLLPYASMRTSSTGAGAYPGTLLLSMDVAVEGLPKADAARYATLLRFAVGSGQTPGLGNGQLPPGYLPLTTTNGGAALTAFSLRAANAVANQTGALPLVTGGTLAPPVPATTGGAGTGGNGGVGTPPPTTTPGPPTTTPPPTTGPVVAGATQPLGSTTGVGSGAGGLVLPLVLLLALVGLLAGPLTGLVLRVRSGR